MDYLKPIQRRLSDVVFESQVGASLEDEIEDGRYIWVAHLVAGVLENCIALVTVLYVYGGMNAWVLQQLCYYIPSAVIELHD